MERRRDRARERCELDELAFLKLRVGGDDPLTAGTLMLAMGGVSGRAGTDQDVLEAGPAGSRLHAVADAGVPFREIAAAIGRGLGVPVVSVPAEQATERFGFLGGFVGIDNLVSSDITRERLGWEPTHPGLLADLDAGHYFAPPSGGE